MYKRREMLGTDAAECWSALQRLSMHELSMADAIIRRVDAEAASRPGVNFVKVGLRVGELSGVNSDALTFGFEMLVKGTRWEHLTLEIENCPRVQRCNACSHEFSAEMYETACPRCGGDDTLCIGGEELDVAYIEVEDQ